MAIGKNTNDLVLVIHGVGDPAPGETLSLFARSMAGTDQPLLEYPEILWLKERDEIKFHVSSFATHVRHLNLQDRSATLVEVFWGDLSRVRRGAIGAVFGLIEILFGIRYIAYVAACQPGFGANWMRRLGLICTTLLHGPVLAINAFLALLSLALVFNETLWPNAAGQLRTQIMIGGCAVIAWIVGGLGKTLTRSTGAREFWFWLEIVAFFISGLMFVKTLWIDSVFPAGAFTGKVEDGLLWYCQVLVMMLALFWLSQMLLVLALGIAWGMAVVSPKVHRTALHAAFLLPALAVGFWALALPMLWLTAANSMKRFAELKKFEDLFREAVPLLGVQFVMAIVVILATAFVLLRYVQWRVRTLNLKLENDGDPPRLVVNAGLQFAIAGCTLAGVTMVATISILQLYGFTYEEIWGAKLLAEANSYAVTFLLPAGFISFMLFPHLRPILDIVLDVMNHFFFRKTRVDDIVDGEEFDIAESTLESGSLYFARRDAILLRIKKTLAYFRDHTSGNPSLTIISHSQGTMIAIEVLNDPELAWLNSSFSSIRLITMGSPFRHLYQHYFQHIYRQLDHIMWQNLHGRLDRWVNIYRRDDFVGTKIDFSKLSLGQQLKYSNHPVGFRGHLNYWSDRDVLAILNRELFERAAPGISETKRAA